MKISPKLSLSPPDKKIKFSQPPWKKRENDARRRGLVEGANRAVRAVKLSNGMKRAARESARERNLCAAARTSKNFAESPLSGGTSSSSSSSRAPEMEGERSWRTRGPFSSYNNSARESERESAHTGCTFPYLQSSRPRAQLWAGDKFVFRRRHKQVCVCVCARMQLSLLI